MRNFVMYRNSYSSPLGQMTMASDGTHLTGLWFDGQAYFPENMPLEETALPIFDETIRWLNVYFSGQVPDFTPALLPDGTPFRQQIWTLLRAIPYGATTTYGALAAQTGREKLSAQAVGGAVGHNPISLIIPCHRVVGANGSLTGYAGGLWRKDFLLKLEQNFHR